MVVATPATDNAVLEAKQELIQMGHSDLARYFDEYLCMTCSDCQANVYPIRCKIYPYIFVDAPGPDPDVILRENEPLELAILVRFSGLGARALMCLNLDLKVSWNAESIGDGPEPSLGSTTIQTQEDQFVYYIKHKVDKNPLKANFVYKVATTVTLGGSETCPALMNGFAAGGFLQIYKP